MAKRSPLKFARPQADTAGSTAERVDVLAKALGEAGKGGEPSLGSQKPQRSRKGLVSTSIWVTKAARLELKHHAQKSETTMEQYILEAINEKLEKDGTDFRIA